MKILKYIPICILCLLTTSIAAQRATNVHARRVGKTIVITYDLDKASYVDLRIAYEVTNTVSMASQTKEHSFYLYRHNYDIPFAVSGDLGIVEAGKSKRIVWDVLKDYDEFIVQNCQFFVETKTLPPPTKGPDMRTFVLAEYGVSIAPQHSWGLMVGQLYNSVGWYINTRSSFNLAQPTDGLTATAGGYVNGQLPFYTGQAKRNHIVANTGIVWDLSLNRWENSIIALYAGLGYGSRYSLWQTVEQQWIKYLPTAYSGVSAQLGVVGSVKGFTMNVGVTAIDFKYAEIEMGLGWMFPTNFKSKNAQK